MKFLRLMAYYPPENVPSANMEKEFELTVASRGISLEIITPYPTRGCDNETRNNFSITEHLHNGYVIIKRFPLYGEPKNSLLRAIRYILGNIIEYFVAIKEKNVDIVLSGSTPPTQMSLARRVAKKLNVPYILRIQDIFPDSMVTAGLTKKGSIIWKIGNALTKRAYLDAAQIMVIGEDMCETLCKRGVPREKIKIVPNWIDTNEIRHICRQENKLMKELGLPCDKFYVVYAGNLGKVQNVSTLVRAAAKLKEQNDIHIVIFGDGVEKDNIIKLAKNLNLNNVSIYPLQKKELISEVYSLGNISVILCQKGAGKTAVPSKTLSILSTATPVLAAFDEDSDLCKMIRDVNCGICVQPENETELADAIYRAYLEKDKLEILGQNGYAYVKNNLDSNICLNRYIETILRNVKVL